MRARCGESNPSVKWAKSQGVVGTQDWKTNMKVEERCLEVLSVEEEGWKEVWMCYCYHSGRCWGAVVII